MARILLQSRKNLFKKPGGDTVQIESLQRGLIKIGYEVDLSLELDPDLGSVALVHCFNITRLQETQLQISNAVNQGTPAVLSPVFHNLTRYFRAGVYGWKRMITRTLSYDSLEQLRNLYLWAFNESDPRACSQFLSLGYVESGRRILSSIQGMVVNSHEEAREVFSFFQPPKTPHYELIPVGVSRSELDTVDERFCAQTRIRNYVLCVGRLEDLKNQVRVFKALENLPISLVFIGHENSKHGSYIRKFHKLVRSHPNAHWFADLDRKTVLSAMKTARVHILASMVETTGLSNLEAGYLGANIVATENGYSREIFKNMAYYCDPEDLSSIRESVSMAISKQASPLLKEYITSRYTEEMCALKHDRLYGKILRDSRSSGGDFPKVLPGTPALSVVQSRNLQESS